MTTKEIVIDPEFQKAIRKLNEDEYSLLRESIKEKGCISPLIVWRQKNILVDGHNRYAICREAGLYFGVHRLNFDTREQAFNWIIKNQLARRNLSKDERDRLLAMAYNAKKKNKNDNLKKGAESPKHQNDASGKVSAEVAKDCGVSQATVERAVRRERDRAELDSLTPEDRERVLEERKGKKAEKFEPKKRINGSYEDWKVYRELGEQAAEILGKMADLKPDKDSKSRVINVILKLERGVTKLKYSLGDN